jgi:hypothetical protein
MGFEIRENAPSAGIRVEEEGCTKKAPRLREGRCWSYEEAMGG